MKVTIGKHEFELGSKYVIELRDSNDIIADFSALRQRIQEDGYLLFRDFHDRDDVLEARQEFMAKLQQMGRLAPNTTMEEGIIGPENKGAMFQGVNHDMPALLNVVNSPRVMNFFDEFLGGKSITYDYKWARAVGSGDFTGAHYDVVYMGRGTKNVYTLWTPLDDVSLEMGGLALCLGSQHFDKIKQTYGEMDVDRDHVTGWFSTDPKEIVDKFGGQWATTGFKAGDVLIFGMYLMHGSLSNTTDKYRISVDTRYQLASEPVDERWFGAKPKGHYGWMQGETVSMEDARKKWGV